MYQIFSHGCALWQLLGFGCRKTPDLKTLYEISNKTHLLPLKTLMGALQPGGTHCAKVPKVLWVGKFCLFKPVANLRQHRSPTKCSKGDTAQESPAWADPTGSCTPGTQHPPTDSTFCLAEGALFQINHLDGWQGTPGQAGLQLTQPATASVCHWDHREFKTNFSWLLECFICSTSCAGVIYDFPSPF